MFVTSTSACFRSLRLVIHVIHPITKKMHTDYHDIPDILLKVMLNIYNSHYPYVLKGAILFYSLH